MASLERLLTIGREQCALLDERRSMRPKAQQDAMIRDVAWGKYRLAQARVSLDPADIEALIRCLQLLTEEHAHHGALPDPLYHAAHHMAEAVGSLVEHRDQWEAIVEAEARGKAA